MLFLLLKHHAGIEMKFEQVCQSINTYFSQKSFFRVLLPLSVPILLVCVVLDVVNCFIRLGSVMNVIVYFIFILAFLLVISTCNFKMIAISLGVEGLTYVYTIIYYLIKYRTFNYSAIIYLLVYGFLAYQAYRKSIQINK